VQLQRVGLGHDPTQTGKQVQPLEVHQLLTQTVGRQRAVHGLQRHQQSQVEEDTQTQTPCPEDGESRIYTRELSGLPEIQHHIQKHVAWRPPICQRRGRPQKTQHQTCHFGGRRTPALQLRGDQILVVAD